LSTRHRAFSGRIATLRWCWRLAFETADGCVALTDFMPIGVADSSVVRLAEGRRGKVAMRLHLTLRFDHRATIPWATQIEDNPLSVRSVDRAWSAPAATGNAAAGQLQLDVFGELVGAIYQSRKHFLAPIASAWTQQQTLIQDVEDIWELQHGIWEVRCGRRQFTFSKVMAWVALDRSVRDAECFGLEAPLARWRELRDRMHAIHAKLREQRARWQPALAAYRGLPPVG
jgi:hypothetical protein